MAATETSEHPEGPYLSGHGIPRLTGERPTPGVTPDSLLALHGAGYREVRARLGNGIVLDVGCGLGFDSSRFAGSGRSIVGVDYDAGAAAQAFHRWGSAGFHAGCMDAVNLGIRGDCVDWVCSSHLIEHFTRPGDHVAEMARVLRPDGTAVIITPNAPADFENPFHVFEFRKDNLEGLLGQFFDDVWIGGLDGAPAVKEDFARRRARGNRLLALDAFKFRHKLPRRWYIAIYTKVLPWVYRMVARGDSGGATGITEDDFFITDSVDSTTLALFAVVSRPYRP